MSPCMIFFNIEIKHFLCRKSVYIYIYMLGLFLIILGLLTWKTKLDSYHVRESVVTTTYLIKSKSSVVAGAIKPLKSCYNIYDLIL